MEKRRLVELDILRGFAILAVVVIHATSTSLQFSQASADIVSTLINQYFNQLFRYATPLFLLLSGVVLALSQRSRPLHPITFYKKRFLRILVPYIAWSIFLGIIAPGAFTGQTLGTIFHNILTGNADYQLYFVILLLECYVLFPFLFHLVDKTQHKTHFKIALLSLLLQLVMIVYLLVGRYSGTSLLGGDFSFRFIAFWIFYFIIGIIVAFHLPKITIAIQHTSMSFLSIITLLSAILLTLEVRILNIAYYDSVNFFRPSVIYFTIISSVTLLRIAIFITERTSMWSNLKQMLVLLGKHSFGIFLLHTLLLRIYIEFFGTQLPPLLFSLVLFTVGLFGSLIVLRTYHVLLYGLPVNIRSKIQAYV